MSILNAGWNAEVIQRIIARARKEQADLETVLLDELTRYLEGKPGTLSELISQDAISLQGIGYTGSLRASFPSERETMHLHEVIARADELGVGAIDMLAVDVELGRLNVREALALAAQFGKHTYRLADEAEAQQTLDLTSSACETRAIESELLARRYHTLQERAVGDHTSNP